jgi:hypothetical protein
MEKRKAYRLLVRKPEGRRPVGPRRRWLDNIRKDLVEVGRGDVDWIGLTQDRDRWRALVNSVLNLRVPQTAGKLSSSSQLHGVSQNYVPYIKTIQITDEAELVERSRK